MKRLAIALVLMSCGSKKESNPAPTTGSAAPAATSEPAAAPTQSFVLAGLGLTVQAPACTKVTEDPTYHTAQLGPSEPGCPVPLALSIRKADDDFKAGSAALHFATSTMGGTNPVETKTADGYRLEYEKGGGKRGLVINRTLGGASINCRGEGRERDIKAIEAICGSLAAK